jgi:succinate-semialdehyde dehydrogenase/glutarate-semialdehyde dehydrogenase
MLPEGLMGRLGTPATADAGVDFAARMEKVQELTRSLVLHRDEVIATAATDIGFTVRDSTREVDNTIERLPAFAEAVGLLSGRRPIARAEQTVGLLPYDGSSWLNIAIVSIWLVGNHVRVKFSSKTSRVARLSAEIYRPIFGDDIQFDYRPGKEFLDWAIDSPEVAAIVIFGSDRHILPYQDRVREEGRKLVFEGPGNDPFIVLDGADLEQTVAALVDAKFVNSGQTCTAPERVFVQAGIHDRFLEALVDRMLSARVGDPMDPSTQVAPLASDLAVDNVQAQLADAAAKGGRILCGGRVQGRLVTPTVVAGATLKMLGMRREIFGPVAFVARFERPAEALAMARDNLYGLRAEVWGEPEAAARVGDELVGKPYLEEVPDFVFGRFGTVSVNQPRSASWRRAFITRPVGGYGYSGWVWESGDGELVLKQGPKLLSLETSVPARD